MATVRHGPLHTHTHTHAHTHARTNTRTPTHTHACTHTNTYIITEVSYPPQLKSIRIRIQITHHGPHDRGVRIVAGDGGLPVGYSVAWCGAVWWGKAGFFLLSQQYTAILSARVFV